MTYTHKMLPLAAQYDQATVEKKWQAHWLAARTYAWDANIARADSYVIDTPPPTVSGTLHMGHVFSYTQADFIARFQRMTGKNVFYPMGFDDNGLPTERLVEKTKKIRATDMSREDFIKVCLGVSEEARVEFRTLFQSIALSVDWAQEYHTISDDSRRLSQMSFLDLVSKGHVYRKLQPMLWDPVDQTAIAQAEVEDKMLPSHFTDIAFTCAETNEELVIGTTRPELLPACVALFYHPDDARYQHLSGKNATVPLFGFSVPILTDSSVEPDKGTGLMMCCTFGDEKDIEKWRKHDLPTRMILNKFGKIDLNLALAEGKFPEGFSWPTALSEALNAKKVSNSDPKHLGARETILNLLKEANLVRQQTAITHAVKCAERSGAALELIPTSQWFVSVTDKKDALKKKANEANWNPDWMRLRIEQWIDGLNWDWCISRQRYFGVPFPVWYVWKIRPDIMVQKDTYIDETGTERGILKPGPDAFLATRTLLASPAQLPINPLRSLPVGMRQANEEELSFIAQRYTVTAPHVAVRIISDVYSTDGKELWFKKDDYAVVVPDLDVMDTWATSSISPQLSAHGITDATADDKARFNSLFPADLRPQAHEIIRTWAFYTIVKAHLHNDQIPWHNLMISGWCLAEDKSKMSKSKGNVITPVALIEERGTDAVRYWAGTSRLGQDTAFSPDLLKIGKKLVGKLWNATAFAAIHLSKMESAPTTAATDTAITETLDRWILSRLGETIAKATEAFARYEYADALDATNQFFWADFCDNYLELIKKRVYGTAIEEAAKEFLSHNDIDALNEKVLPAAAGKQSAVRTLYYVLDGILKLYAPFTPHVTEELYSHIFADSYAAKGSLHAKNQWPNAKEYPLDTSAIKAGIVALEIVEAVRKVKSEASKSVKWPVDSIEASNHRLSELSAHELNSVAGDIKGACNARSLKWTNHAIDAANPDYVVLVVLAAEADAA